MSTTPSDSFNKDNAVKPLNSSKRMRQVLKNGQFQEVPDSEVDYEFTNPQQLFTHELNLIPFQNAVQSQRTFYTSKFWNQAVPIEHGEVPFIQTLRDKATNETFQNYVGKKTGVVSANENDDGATVTAITPDEITLKSSSGKTIRKPLYNNYSFNRKTYVTNIPTVKIGDKIKKDQILARTNYTDDKGNLAMGLNARVAMVPYKGWTYEDSIVVSEDFAKRMASQHMYGFYQDKDSDAIKTSKPHYETMFPGKFDREQLKNIDDNGVVKVGTKVHYGDPLILSTKARMISSKDQELGRLSKYLKNTRSDASVTWDHHSDGEVTDVVKTKDGWRVNVKSVSPLKEGDKITQLSGNKCYHPDTEIFTENGWKPIAEITLDDKVAALFDRNLFLHDDLTKKRTKQPQDLYAKFVYPLATTSYEYNGLLCGLEAAHAAYLVTPNHRVFSRSNSRYCKNRSRWECRDASEIHGMNRVFLPSVKFELVDRIRPSYIEIPYLPYKDPSLNQSFNNQSRFIPEDFVIFLAFYLAEGNVSHSEFSRKKSIVITQQKRGFTKGLEDLFRRMNFEYSYSESSQQYIIHKQKSLAEYLFQFGKAPDKFIPDIIKKLPVDLLQLFLATYMQGDGNKTVANTIYTSSSKMANDIAEIMIMCGCTPIISVRDRRDSLTLIKTKIIKRNTLEYVVFAMQRNTVGTQKTYKKAYYQQSYSGRVYCCQVPGLGVILTRLHGKIMWNGNSTISKIIPMNEMPRTMDGKPLDVLINPLALPSRVNSSMIQSVLLGKIAEKTGKPYILPSFNHRNESWIDFTENELKKNNIPETEEIYDPILDRTLDQPVTVGNEYFLKLHHIGESKLSSRDTGIYTQDQTPAKGGEELQKAKRLSGLEATALVSASAYNIIKDGLHLRGQKNDDYWRAVRRGETPTLVKKSPFVWDKYIALMQGAGINPRQVEEGVLQASPFTDAQFERLQPVELKNADIVDVKNFKPVEGGLFDPAMSLTNKWGKITLTQPYPNPGFEDAIVSLLGIKKSDMYEIMQGKKNLGSYGTGNMAIYNALKNININEMFKDAKDDFKNAPKSQKQKALNRMRYLQGLQRNNMRAEEYMITRVPVLPAEFRPYAVMGDTFLPGDANELYKDVFQMNNIQKEMMEKLGPKYAQENNLNMYKSIKALYGFGESPNRKLQQRGVSGFLDKLVGGTSKFSYLNRVVDSKPVDQSSRSVIEMSPELNMNEIDLPNEMAFKIFAPYIQGELVKQGMRPRDAIKAIKDRDEATAGKALDNIMKDRVVWYSRAPAWHRFNALAAYAKRHEGNNILIPPVVSSGAGADNDGDDQIAFVYVAIKK